MIDLATLRTRNLSVRAETEPTSVGSVVFGYDGNGRFRIENNPPYLLGGNIGTSFLDWTPTEGSHTLVATPYTGSNGSGDAGRGLAINFDIVDRAVTPIDTTTLRVPTLESEPTARAPLVDESTPEPTTEPTDLPETTVTLPFEEGFETGTLDRWTATEHFAVVEAEDPLGGSYARPGGEHR